MLLCYVIVGFAVLENSEDDGWTHWSIFTFLVEEALRGSIYVGDLYTAY